MESVADKQLELYMEKLIPKLFLGVIVTAVLVCIISLSPVQDVRINNEQVFMLADSWDVFTADGRFIEKVNLPAKIDVLIDEEYYITRKLPESFTDGMTASFRSSQQFVKVSVEDKLIYSFGYEGKTKIGKSPGSIWNFVRIPTDYKGKEIKISFKSPYKSYSGVIPEIVYGTKTANVFYILSMGVPAALVCILIGVLGILLVAFFCFTRKHSKSLSILYLGLFSLVSSVWTLGETKILQLFTANISTVTIVTFSSLMLIPIPFFLFVRETYITTNKKYVNLACMSFIVIYIVLTVLQVLNIADYMQTITVFHIDLAVCSIILFSHIAYSAFVKGVKATRGFIYAFSSLIVAEVLDVMSFYLFPRILDAAFFFRLGLLVSISILAAQLGRRTYNMVEENLRITVLEKIAFTDLLTNLKNRTCFEQDMDYYREEIKRCIGLTILVFDVNNLKRVNDTFGHKVGDELILKSGECIAKSLSDKGKLYRIGGDEFVCLCQHISDDQIKQITSGIEDTTKQTKISSGNTISIAYGAASYDPQLDSNVEDVFKRADVAMYEKKVIMKGLMGRRRSDIQGSELPNPKS